jgi:hypothetical protein
VAFFIKLTAHATMKKINALLNPYQALVAFVEFKHAAPSNDEKA